MTASAAPTSAPDPAAAPCQPRPSHMDSVYGPFPEVSALVFYVFFFCSFPRLFYSFYFFFLVLFILGVSDRRKLVAASCSVRFGSPVGWLVGWWLSVG